MYVYIYIYIYIREPLFFGYGFRVFGYGFPKRGSFQSCCKCSFKGRAHPFTFKGSIREPQRICKGSGFLYRFLL